MIKREHAGETFVVGTCETCGGTGEPCCQIDLTSDPFCASENVCLEGTCVACGELGEPCCPGSNNFGFCGTNEPRNGKFAQCSSRVGDGECVACGAPGEPCCQALLDSEPFCVLSVECLPSGVCGTSSNPVRHHHGYQFRSFLKMPRNWCCADYE